MNSGNPFHIRASAHRSEWGGGSDEPRVLPGRGARVKAAHHGTQEVGPGAGGSGRGEPGGPVGARWCLWLRRGTQEGRGAPGWLPGSWVGGRGYELRASTIETAMATSKSNDILRAIAIAPEVMLPPLAGAAPPGCPVASRRSSNDLGRARRRGSRALALEPSRRSRATPAGLPWRTLAVHVPRTRAGVS
jgi:hypothetical protein